MKRLIILAALALVALGVVAATASAGTNDWYWNPASKQCLEKPQWEGTPSNGWTGPYTDSTCETPVTPPVEHDYALTLLVDGGSSAAIADGDSVTFSGTYTDNSVGLSDEDVDLTVYSGYGCSGEPFDSSSGYFLTGAGGSYGDGYGPLSTGEYSAQTNVGELGSNCVDITVGEANPPAGAAALPPRPDNSFFLCYSAFQTVPGVWSEKQAKVLLTQGYWQAYAVKGTVPGGTNIGGYHLVCNLAGTQAVTGSFAGGAGETVGRGYVADNIGYYSVIGG